MTQEMDEFHEIVRGDAPAIEFEGMALRLHHRNRIREPNDVREA